MGSQAFAPPSPCQGEGWGEDASRRRLFPLTQPLSPSGGEGAQGGRPCPVAQKTLQKKAIKGEGQFTSPSQPPMGQGKRAVC
jgi:hypothetical protein